MRFIDPEDDERLTAMVAEGAIDRASFEGAVGNRAVLLREAIADFAEIIPPAGWLTWCIRAGFLRVNHAVATPGFVRSLALSDAEVRTLHEQWLFPFARNHLGELLVARIPLYTPPLDSLSILGPNPIYCAATPGEFRSLRDAYQVASY